MLELTVCALTNSQTSEVGKHMQNVYGSSGIRTHASEETGALNQRLRPLGHATHISIVRPAMLTDAGKLPRVKQSDAKNIVV